MNDDERRGAGPGRPQAEERPDEVSYGVRKAFAELIAEIDNLRAELGRNNARIRHLESLSARDSLTAVANRRAFMREIERFTAFAGRYDAPSCLIYLDVEGMKGINATRGHRAGDAVLCAVADTLLANVRASDVVGRLGGDEFGVILARTDLDTARRKAEALARRVAESPVEDAGGPIPVSVSCGVFALTGEAGAHDAIDGAFRAVAARGADAD